MHIVTRKRFSRVVLHICAKRCSYKGVKKCPNRLGIKCEIGWDTFYEPLRQRFPLFSLFILFSNDVKKGK